MPRIYADNAATTKISQTAMKAMISAMENSYGNPSSIHQIGMAANDALQTAREQIARCLGCMPKEIFFTSGGTESDNQAIMSAAMLVRNRIRGILFLLRLSIMRCFIL